MSKKPSFVEPLEDRRLLSISPALALPGPGFVFPSAATTQQAQPVASAVHKAAARSTNLIGQWKGSVSVKVLFFKQTVAATLNITGQAANTLTGSIEAFGQKLTGTLKGSINKTTGNFTYRLSNSDGNVTITGHLNAAGTVMTGTIAGKYMGVSGSGSFSFTKVK